MNSEQVQPNNQQIQQLTDEQRNLLDSHHDVQIVNHQQSENDLSKMDQSIEVGHDVEEVRKNENGYQEIIGSESSLYNPERNLKLGEEKKPLTRFARIKNFVKQAFTCNSKCKMNESTFSDKQLAASIFLRGAAAFYMFKKRQQLIERRNKSIADEKVLRNIDKNLQNNGFLYYDHSTNGQKTLLKGQFIKKSFPKQQQIEIKSQNSSNEKGFLISSSETRKVTLATDQYEVAAVPIPLQSQQSRFTAAVAGLTYFLSSNIYQIKFKTDSLNNFSESFYFFGTKNNVTNIISVEKIFQKINWLRIQSDQRALKICTVLASALTVFFTYKAIKSAVLLTKRKKSFFQRMYMEIKEYMSL